MRPYPVIGDVFFLSCVHIAHLSDPHLPLVGLPSFREILFKRIFSLLSWQLRRKHLHKLSALHAVMQDIRCFHPDMVALTGDLTNLGLLKEFQQARQWLLQQNLPPTLLVPGNHDALIKENSDTKQKLWAEWLRHTPQDTPSLLVKDHVALIGLNTAVPTLPFLASGKAGHSQLMLLATLLRRTRAMGLCRIVLLHHPPAQGIVSRRKGLDDVAPLQGVLRAEGAELVLYGHSHRAQITTIPGTDILAVSSTSASHIADDPAKNAGWNAISVQKQPDTWQITIQHRSLMPDGNLQDSQMRRVCNAHRLLPITSL
ncbi:metallophosphoesterase family protein [Acetobacter pomorum]|uniref:metallophosphoesterase family protein n=1 Tax=Acetobacter pomorum TaxID=65959 RepID=UPI001605CB80|nr:metallophosphoesterase [Acetobacter pomorum]